MQYGTEGGIQSQTDVLIQLGGFYETFGFEQPRNRTKERVDHLSIELAFMFFMCFRTAFGVQNGHDERNINVLTSNMKKFMRNHIGRWGPNLGGFYYFKNVGYPATRTTTRRRAPQSKTAISLQPLRHRSAHDHRQQRNP